MREEFDIDIPPIFHCVGIKNYSSLICGKLFYKHTHINACPKCHKKFESAEELNKHINTYKCDDRIFKMPKEEKNILKYKSNGHQTSSP